MPATEQHLQEGVSNRGYEGQIDPQPMSASGWPPGDDRWQAPPSRAGEPPQIDPALLNGQSVWAIHRPACCRPMLTRGDHGPCEDDALDEVLLREEEDQQAESSQ
jgi:hypothetical protein